MQTYQLIIPVSIILLCGCQQAREQVIDNPVDLEKDSIYYEIKAFNREYGDCQIDTSAYCTRVSFTYPVFGSEKYAGQASAINNTIQRSLLKEFYPDTIENKSIEAFADQFIDDYKEIKASFGEAFGWYANMNGTVLRNDSSTITVELKSDLYTGGAHGNITVKYLNFNPATGNIITLDSLFKRGYKEELNKIVEDRFRKTHGISPNADLSDEGFQFENELYYNAENFAFLADGIKFYYNNYEIAPYSSGPFEVMVPYNEIKDLIRKDQE